MIVQNENSRPVVDTSIFTEDQKKAYNNLIEFIRADYNPNDYKRALVGPAGTGKALLNGTPVLTNEGWKEIQYLQVGDMVATPFHTYSKVIGVYPQPAKEQGYFIKFSDGRSIIADENHLWAVRDKRLLEKYRAIYKDWNSRTVSCVVMSTKEIIRRNDKDWYIPTAVKGVYGEYQHLPLSPYVLGVMLGRALDVRLTPKGITLPKLESDIVVLVENEFGNKKKSIIRQQIRKVWVEYQFDNIGPYIPSQYMLSSIAQRWEVLAGLFDVCGYINSRGQYLMKTKALGLFICMQQLCWSLGLIIICHTTIVDNKPVYDMIINIPAEQDRVPFRRVKHRAAWTETIKDTPRKHLDHLKIVKIEKLRMPSEFTCIAIEDSDKLFIVNNYIVTHNTFVTKALIQNSGLSYSSIGLAAPTHKAARVLAESVRLPNIKVNTLQSDLGLRLNFDAEKFDIDNPPFDPRGKVKIGDYSVYIVDEASMINAGMLSFLEKICRANFCKLIYLGDDKQLAPVNERHSAAFKGVKMLTLNQIVRQGEDNPISYLLELLRFDITHKTFTFLEYISKHPMQFNEAGTKGYQVCSSKLFEQMVYRNFGDEELKSNIDYAKVISYTNNSVSAWNKFIRHTIIKDSDKSVITKNDLIISYVTIVNKFNECVIKNSEEYILQDIVNYTHPQYGIKGFMVRFTAIHGGMTTTPLFIIDHKDRFAIAMYVKTSRDLIHDAKYSSKAMRASKWKEYFAFKESCLLLTNIVRPDGTIEFSRDLDYGFALTAHKSQGSTFDTTLVDVKDIVFDKYGHPYTDAEDVNRRLYVACSRCKNKLYLRYGQ